MLRRRVPQKQGLKQNTNGDEELSEALRRRVPQKQGLKPLITPSVSERPDVFEGEFHKNKD